MRTILAMILLVIAGTAFSVSQPIVAQEKNEPEASSDKDLKFPWTIEQLRDTFKTGMKYTLRDETVEGEERLVQIMNVAVMGQTKDGAFLQSKLTFPKVDGTYVVHGEAPWKKIWDTFQMISKEATYKDASTETAAGKFDCRVLEFNAGSGSNKVSLVSYLSLKYPGLAIRTTTRTFTAEGKERSLHEQSVEAFTPADGKQPEPSLPWSDYQFKDFCKRELAYTHTQSITKESDTTKTETRRYVSRVTDEECEFSDFTSGESKDDAKKLHNSAKWDRIAASWDTWLSSTLIARSELAVSFEEIEVAAGKFHCLVYKTKASEVEKDGQTTLYLDPNLPGIVIKLVKQKGKAYQLVRELKSISVPGR